MQRFATVSLCTVDVGSERGETFRECAELSVHSGAKGLGGSSVVLAKFSDAGRTINASTICSRETN